MKDGALRGDGDSALGERVEVNEAPDGGRFRARLVSRRRFAAGEVVAAIPPHRVVDAPSYRSVQIAADRHIEDIGVLAYLNHSCHPNVRIDVERLAVVALDDIAEGDELTFFYPATEWDMAQPFRCWCGAAHCLGWVAGAKAVPKQVLARYGVAPHIARLAKLRQF
jgi:hypothetical protein